MNRLIIYCRYVINLSKLIYYKLIFRKKIKFKLLQLMGKRFSITIKGKSGKLIVGKKTYTRSNFNIIVDNGICNIGEECFFNHNCSITCLKSIIIGNKCTFGNNVVIVDHDHNFNNDCNEKFLKSKIVIGDGSWIGANTTILRGSKIGNNCVVAAGSIVKGEIPDNSIYYNEKKVIIKKINK